jgi:hypothetical protein
MKSKAPKFCIQCGESLKKYERDVFDAFTGEKKVGLRCENDFCEEGCGNLGHKWGSFWKLQHEKCQRCGYSIQDY